MSMSNFVVVSLNLSSFELIPGSKSKPTQLLPAKNNLDTKTKNIKCKNIKHETKMIQNQKLKERMCLSSKSRHTRENMLTREDG